VTSTPNDPDETVPPEVVQSVEGPQSESQRGDGPPAVVRIDPELSSRVLKGEAVIHLVEVDGEWVVASQFDRSWNEPEQDPQ
jgi:hypothetical protein